MKQDIIMWILAKVVIVTSGWFVAWVTLAKMGVDVVFDETGIPNEIVNYPFVAGLSAWVSSTFVKMYKKKDAQLQKEKDDHLKSIEASAQREIKSIEKHIDMLYKLYGDARNKL